MSTAREPRREPGELAFGTVDSFLLWRLTGGKRARDRRDQRRAHAAARHRHRHAGTRICCELFGVPPSLLPEVRDCAGDFGTTAPELFGGPIRILGVAGDQQAATVGQGCFRPA